MVGERPVALGPLVNSDGGWLEYTLACMQPENSDGLLLPSRGGNVFGRPYVADVERS